MKYFLDTEFHEFKKKTFFGKAIDTIELISIGVVAEDGRTYYAISKDFDVKAAWNNEWLRDNVLLTIWKEHVHGDMRYVSSFSYSSVKAIVKGFGKSNKQIVEEIKDFTKDKIELGSDGLCRCNQATSCPNGKVASMPRCTSEELKEYFPSKIEFYGCYSDYDWVVFCWLFGRMIDLPKGFPKFCIDLKQELNRKADTFKRNDFFTAADFKDEKLPELTLEEKVKHLKMHVRYPEQTNTHHALSDAKWNYELYKFLQTL